jgi:hypothetical protein
MCVRLRGQFVVSYGGGGGGGVGGVVISLRFVSSELVCLFLSLSPSDIICLQCGVMW